MPFVQLAATLTRRAGLFDELRDALRLQAKPSGRNEAAPASPAAADAAVTELRDVKQAVEDLVAALRERRPQRGPAQDTRAAIDLVLRHVDKSTAPPCGDTPSRCRMPRAAASVSWTAPTTRSRGSSTPSKHGERRRSGRKILTQDLESLPPAAALTPNLSRADYVHVFCGSLDQLLRALAQLDAASERSWSPRPDRPAAPGRPPPRHRRQPMTTIPLPQRLRYPRRTGVIRADAMRQRILAAAGSRAPWQPDEPAAAGQPDRGAVVLEVAPLCHDGGSGLSCTLVKRGRPCSYWPNSFVGTAPMMSPGELPGRLVIRYACFAGPTICVPGFLGLAAPGIFASGAPWFGSTVGANTLLLTITLAFAVFGCLVGARQLAPSKWFLVFPTAAALVGILGSQLAVGDAIREMSGAVPDMLFEQWFAHEALAGMPRAIGFSVAAFMCLALVGLNLLARPTASGLAAGVYAAAFLVSSMCSFAYVQEAQTVWALALSGFDQEALAAPISGSSRDFSDLIHLSFWAGSTIVMLAAMFMWRRQSIHEYVRAGVVVFGASVTFIANLGYEASTRHAIERIHGTMAPRLRSESLLERTGDRIERAKFDDATAVVRGYARTTGLRTMAAASEHDGDEFSGGEHGTILGNATDCFSTYPPMLWPEVEIVDVYKADSNFTSRPGDRISIGHYGWNEVPAGDCTFYLELKSPASYDDYDWVLLDRSVEAGTSDCVGRP